VGFQDAQQVCLNGHQITDSYHTFPSGRRAHCEKCGERTIYQCPDCNAPINGDYHVEGVLALGGHTPVPEYCHACGSPYPWTKRSQRDLPPSESALDASATHMTSYVDPIRISQLESLLSGRFDFSKLAQLCRELQSSFDAGNFFAVLFLIRAILDHVPPLFECRSFAEVANNYVGGGQSFRSAMLHLENTSRKIADRHLHGQISRKEVLPTAVQVNFASDLDLLLSEIVRVHSGE